MKTYFSIGLALSMGALVLAPATAHAQWGRYESERRQETKNEWRNIAIASGLLGALGALNKDKTLTFVGAAGALYSAYRYEQDRKSQNRIDRARAAYFDRDFFYRDGRRFERRTAFQRGQKYYQFVCVDDDRRNGWDNGRFNPHREARWDDDDRRGDERRWDDRSKRNSKGNSNGKGKKRGGSCDD